MSELSDAEHSALWSHRLQDSLDGELDATRQGELSKHLESCAACRDEHAALQALHARLNTEFKSIPELSQDFSARVLANVDDQEHARRAIAKQQAELKFRERLRAFDFDWRELSRRHFGNLIAGLAVITAALAASSSMWEELSDRFADSVATIPLFHGVTLLTAAAVGVSVSISAATLWILRTKSR